MTRPVGTTPQLTNSQQQQWDTDGFFIVRDFLSNGASNESADVPDSDITTAMLERVIQISRQAKGEPLSDGFLISAENNLADGAHVAANDAPAELRVSKIFKLHRDPVFRSFIESSEILEIGRNLLGPQLDCFLSQFIFKNPGAWGQPWHQDSYYFPFDQGPQVGFWLAVTEATLDNGCLWVLPGSHREPVHKHVLDRRPNANVGYVEIIDHDFTQAQPVTMAPGDLLVFHSHLMHRSRDNLSNQLRAAMVYHMAARGTQDLSKSPARVNDWVALPD